MVKYAYPQRKRYPLTSRQKVHAAIAHFGANYRLYSPSVQAEIAQHLRGAAKRYGIEIHSPVILQK